MPDDWSIGDPFADPDDPAAAAREKRRKEREEKRQSRRGDDGGAGEEPAQPAAPPPAEPTPPAPKADIPAPRPPAPDPPVPPVPPRTPEDEFWDEDPEPYEEEEAEEPPGPVGGEPRSRAAAGSPRDRGPRPPGRAAGVLGALRRHPFRVVGGIVALLVLWFLFALFQPFHGDGTGRVVVKIPKGASVSEVGDILDEKGVVSSSTLFQVRVTVAGERSGLYPGRFVLAKDMSYGSAIDALSKAPVKKVSTITIPEGYTREQIASVAEEAGLEGSYMDASVNSKYINLAKYGGKGAESLEGFLFPDTFYLKPGAPAADLVQLQVEDFKRRIKGVDMGYAKSKNLTVFDVVTIASMVQAESGTSSQDPLVAAVIYNRLKKGMSLGIDATVRYAVGNFDSPLTESELATDSPYNTRINTGLPPGPIGNPGLAAIEAAAHPAKADYLFYVTKPGACNELEFSKTEAEFEADVAAYNEAREAAGGNNPDTC
jgi:uncharacterized YceG family protein